MEFVELIKANEELRNQRWETDFLSLFPQQKVGLLYPEPKPGPDSFPYLMVSTDENPTEPVADILAWLSNRGIGLAVNPNKELPDYIFTYGMIWNWAQTGQFVLEASFSTSTSFNLSANEKIHCGPPTEEYLPEKVKSILKEFWLQQGIYRPRILLVSNNQKDYDLCFSAESLNSPPSNEYDGIAEAISWFLPNHYRIVITSEKNLPTFYDL